MFKIAVVVFRECLEIALMLGVILAVTKPIQNSRFYIIFGTLTGIVLASSFAFFMRSVATLFNGLGDEIFDSTVILLTAIIISFTVVWMQGYTKKIKKDLYSLSDKIVCGTSSKFMLAIVVASTILREGVEILLFIYSITSAENISINEYAWGLAIGGGGGFFVGLVLYKGLIGFAGKYVFKICTILLVMIAAGLSSEAAGILTSTGIIDFYNYPLWDTSWLIEDRSVFGKIFHVITGYSSKPNGMQLIFYFSMILFIIVMTKIRTKFIKDQAI